jgi:hypothetical protein
MKRYPIIGGPLQGQCANYEEMRTATIAYRDSGRWKKGDLISPGGKFHTYADQYVAYNRANGYDRIPTMIWLHSDLLLR